MNKLSAKKYSKALIDVCGEEEIRSVAELFERAATLFENDKFVDIVKSPLVDGAAKSSLITEAFAGANPKFLNAVRILAEKNRLILIPQISRELRYHIAATGGNFTGRILSRGALDPAKVAELEGKLSGRLGVTLKLEAKEGKYDGVKVEVPEMGVEVDFSQARLKSQMLSHILKAL